MVDESPASGGRPGFLFLVTSIPPSTSQFFLGSRIGKRRFQILTSTFDTVYLYRQSVHLLDRRPFLGDVVLFSNRRRDSQDFMPTIKDVARQSGVSIATVSAVINDAEWVPEETRARVRVAIKKLNYRPNRLAQGLKTRRSYSVGVIVSDVTNPFYTEVVRGLGHELRKEGRNLVLCDSDNRFELGEENYRMLLEKQVDAIVLIGDSVQEDVVSRFVLENRKVPVVAIERDYAVDSVSRLLVDSEQGAFDATMHLIRQGFTRIGMISGPLTGPGSKSYGRMHQYRGYRRALQLGGIPFDSFLVADGDFRFSGGQDAMRRLLEVSERPEAVFVANDLMALGAMDIAREAGLSIPREIALIGYDDVAIAAYTSPPLTTMAIPKAELGRSAAQVLLDNLKNPGKTRPVRRIFPARLVVRASAVFELEPDLQSSG